MKGHKFLKITGILMIVSAAISRRSRSGSVHLRRSAEQQDRGRVCGIKKKKQNNEKKRSFVCTPAVYRDRVGSIGSQQVGAFPKQFGREL